MRAPLSALLLLAAVVSASCSAPGFVPGHIPVASGSIFPSVACPTLAGRAIPADLIGLPSGNAIITSATYVPAAGALAEGTSYTGASPEHCRVVGRIAPVDKAAQDIQFQVNLPSSWNGKAVQYGGGGYNGTLVTGLAPLRDAAPDDASPLTRGFVTLGTDSGHQAASFAPNAIGQFGLNDEMLANYAFASYKKVRDVAVAVMRTYYGRKPARIYYFGGSEGGREGLTMAQRFPADYDGVVSVVPVVQLSMLFQSYIPRSVPQFEGGWLSPAKVRTLGRYVAQRCDALDGLADGVVNNYLACPRQVDLRALRCTGGADTGDNCLSDAQIAVVDSVHRPYNFPFPLANGRQVYPGWFYGNETTPDPVLPTMTRWVTGSAAPTEPPDARTAAQYWLYGSNYVKYFVVRDGNFDVRTYRPEHFQPRLEQVSAILDSSNPDLSAFFARGGKLIVRENMGDLAQSPQAGIDYFQAVRARLGDAAVERSMRLYISPASTHSGPAASVTTGAPVATMVDLLEPLDRWVTTDDPPYSALVQVLKTPVPPFTLLASRPMCRYPFYPHFIGGDPAAASSYECRESRP